MFPTNQSWATFTTKVNLKQNTKRRAERSRHAHTMIGHDSPIMDSHHYQSAGSENDEEVPKGIKIHQVKSAVITPPKDPKEETLLAAIPTSPNPRFDAPFSPIKTTPEYGGEDFEPLPYKVVNIFEKSPCSPSTWQQRVYSPIQATPNPANKNGHENQVADKLPSLIDLSEAIRTPTGNGVDEKEPQLPPGDGVKSDAEKPPAYHPHHQWPVHPPSTHYWHQQYHYGYYHHYGLHDNQPKKGSLPYPPLYPNPQNNHYHVPYGHFGSTAHVPFCQEYVTDVTHNDVICGRGGAVNNHPGNMRFRQFIQQFKHQYMIESKQSKPYVAILVIEAVKSSNPPGRFLVKYPGGYLECGDDRSREKAKQALREGAAKLRKLASVVESGEVEASHDAIEQRGMKRILLPNERSCDEIEYQHNPEYSNIFEPPHKKQDDAFESPRKKIKEKDQNEEAV